MDTYKNVKTLRVELTKNELNKGSTNTYTVNYFRAIRQILGIEYVTMFRFNKFCIRDTITVKNMEDYKPRELCIWIHQFGKQVMTSNEYDNITTTVPICSNCDTNYISSDPIRLCPPHAMSIYSINVVVEDEEGREVDFHGDSWSFEVDMYE